MIDRIVLAHSYAIIGLGLGFAIGTVLRGLIAFYF